METGVRFFLGALDWMLRHEIAQVVLKHAVREKSGGITYREGEIEANAQAAKWLKASLEADPQRELGGRPGETELNLE
ncbi:MAG: phage exclusion protein Lit family protein [Acidobacteriota bacterium]